MVELIQNIQEYVWEEAKKGRDYTTIVTNYVNRFNGELGEDNRRKLFHDLATLEKVTEEDVCQFIGATNFLLRLKKRQSK